MRKKIFTCMLSLAMVVSMAGITPLTVSAISDNVIHVNSISGEDTYDGGSPDTAVKTLTRAFQLVNAPNEKYNIIVESGDYAAPGVVTIPSGAEVFVTTGDDYSTVKFYKDPEAISDNLFEFRGQAFAGISFERIIFTGDDPATGTLEDSGTGIYVYDCESAGNTAAFKNCIFENLGTGIWQDYSETLSVIVEDSDITANFPIRMGYAKKLTVKNSQLMLSDKADSWIPIIYLDGSNINVQITDNTLIGNNGAGRGIYEDVYSGTISGNTFRDLDVAIEADMHSVTIANNSIETTQYGMDIEPCDLYDYPGDNATCNISITNNSIINTGLKTAGYAGIKIYNDEDEITAAAFTIQGNKIINFYTGLEYSDDHYAGMSFDLSGNSFWGNIFNIECSLNWISDETPIDATNNDWGTTDRAEVIARIYVSGETTADVFVFDEELSSDMVETAYVNWEYSSGNAGGHTFGVDAFTSITEALPYVKSGGQILVESGNYIAPVWIDRPVHIKGIGNEVYLSKHPSITGYGNVTTTITVAGVILEQLNFRNGDNGLKFGAFSQKGYITYPDYYKILNCSFTNFEQTAIYEPESPPMGYEITPGRTKEIRGNIISRTTEFPNGTGVYVHSQVDNLVFSENELTGDYVYGVYLNGKNITAQNNNIAVHATYSEHAFGMSSTGNLTCTDNVLSNSSPVANGLDTIGLSIDFNDTEGLTPVSPFLKEIYRNDVTGFNYGISLHGTENSEIFDVTIGGSTANANDFSGNEYGLTSQLSNFDEESTDATYNKWGLPDASLPAYIRGYHNDATYGRVTFLPSAASASSNNAGLSALSATGISLKPAFSTAVTSYSADVKNNISSTVVTATCSHAGAAVSINGSSGLSKEIPLVVGTNTITVTVTAEDGITTKAYTLTIIRAAAETPSTGGGSGGAVPPAIAVTTTESGSSTINSAKILAEAASGSAKAAITNEIVDALLAKASSTEGTSKEDLIRVTIDAPNDIKKLQADMPQSEFNRIASGTNANFGIESPLISVVFDAKAVETISEATSDGNVVITAERLADLNGRPVYDLTVTNGGKAVADFKGGHATVTIPYILKSGEDPNAVVIYYLTDNGNLKSMRGHYRADLKAVVLKTPHFSNFTIGYNPISFHDVRSEDWYKDAVNFIAARDITSGTGSGNFTPDAKLTRGQFVVLLMNAYQISTENRAETNFSDAGDTYYTNYLTAAKNLGIVNGIGNNLFAPDKEITRQEMFVMIYNALKVIDEIPTAVNSTQLSSFHDASNTADWANESLSSLIKAGVVQGHNNNLSPTATTTRAEIAQVLYNLLSK